MITVWQQLGSFIYTGPNLSRETVNHFHKIGGRWVALLVYNDTEVAEANRKFFPGLRAWCRTLTPPLKIFNWGVGRGGDPLEDSKSIAGITLNLGMDGIILNLEAEYQYPGGDADKMPIMTADLRHRLPTAEIGVSSNELNSSQIWNGRILNPKASFYDLKIRVLPQWYNPYYDKSGKTPVSVMSWLKNNGHIDFNFRDDNAKATRYRGVPLSYVHPTLEHTGIEGANLQKEIADTLLARPYGLTPGISTYTLERASYEDLDLLERFKGVLYLA